MTNNRLPRVSKFSFSSPTTPPKANSTDLSNQETLARLVDCLLFSCVPHDTESLPVKLGLPASLDYRDALSVWILNEMQNVKLIDANALFNYLANRLDALLLKYGRNQA